MRWGLVFVVAFFALQAIAYDIASCPSNQLPVGGTVTFFPVPQGAIDQTKQLFPEGKHPVNTLTSNDIFIEFKTAGKLSLTFMWEGAGYRNVFGYFLVDKTTGRVKDNSYTTIFQDVTWSGEGGCMSTGVTVNVSQAFKAGDVVGFWILADGFNGGSDRWYSINSTTIYNADKYRHAVWAKLANYDDIVLIGFEDLRDLGDADFNDVMFYATITGSYNDDDIPVYNNGTLETCEPSEIVEYNEVECTQFALLTSSNPLACQAYIDLAAGWQLAPDTPTSREAIRSFGPDAGCIVLATGKGYNYTNQECYSGGIKGGSFDGKSCYTVGCEQSILVIGQTVSGCTGIPNTACDPAVKANVVNQLPSQYTEGVAINPTNYGLFLNKLAGTQANKALSFSVAIPAKPKVEIQLLVDLNSMNSAAWSNFKTGGIASIHNNLASDFIPSVGLSTIDTNGQLTIRPITPSANTLLSQYTAVSGIPSNANTNPTNVWSHWTTLVNSNSAAGWSKGAAYRFVVVITSQTLASADTTAAVAAHLNKMIIPIVLGSSVSVADFKMAGSEAISPHTTLVSTWGNKLSTIVGTLATTVRFTPVNDISSSGGFIQTLPADKKNPTPGSPYVTSVTVRFPTVPTSGVSFPYALKIVLWGYDLITVNIIINTDPVIRAPNSVSANWNETKPFTVLAYDDDGNIMTITYTSVSPANASGLISSSKGVKFSTALPNKSSDFSGSFSPNGWNSGAIVASGTVSDGCASVPFTYTFTAFQKPNTPPNSRSIQYTTPEDTPLNAPIPKLGDQEDAESALVAQIVNIVGQGTFYLDSTKTTPLTPSLLLSTVAARSSIYYVPPANAYSTGNTPLAYFTFIAIDSVGETSDPKNPYSVSVIVTPVNDPPVFTGNTIITIDEDTRAELGLRDYLEDVDTDLADIQVIIGQNVQRGHLYECVPSDSGCTLVEITSVPHTIDIESNPSARVVFIPLPDENGDNYATFNLIADDGDNKPVFTITINVRPVNDPPVITPFFTLLPQWNEMDEDTEHVLSWNVTDIDSPVESLTIDSRAFPTTFAGKLYQYVPNGDSYTRGDEITGSGAIPRVSPGVWSVIVVPNPNVYDNAFLRLRLTAYDDFQAPSLPVNAPVRVLPINDAPVIAATEQTLTRTDNMQITLGFISVSDIDAGRKNVSVSFTVQDNSVGVFGYDSLTGRQERTNPCTMNAANTSVVCTDDLDTLNQKWFKLIIYYPGTTGSQVITVFADDHGNTDKWLRPLNDTKLVSVQIGEDTGLLTDPGTDNTLTIAVAVSVAGAVGAVALVLFLVRDKLAGQTDAYFESLTEPLSTGGVNPVYQQAGSSGQNPTYVPRV